MNDLNRLIIGIVIGFIASSIILIWRRLYEIYKYAICEKSPTLYHTPKREGNHFVCGHCGKLIHFSIKANRWVGIKNE